MVPPPMIPQLTFQGTGPAELQKHSKFLINSYSVSATDWLQKHQCLRIISVNIFTQSWTTTAFRNLFYQQYRSFKKNQDVGKNYNIHQKLKQHCLIKLAAAMKMFYVCMMSRMVATSYMWLLGTSNVTSALEELIFFKLYLS